MSNKNTMKTYSTKDNKRILFSAIVSTISFSSLTRDWCKCNDINKNIYFFLNYVAQFLIFINYYVNYINSFHINMCLDPTSPCIIVIRITRR